LGLARPASQKFNNNGSSRGGQPRPGASSLGPPPEKLGAAAVLWARGGWSRASSLQPPGCRGRAAEARGRPGVHLPPPPNDGGKWRPWHLPRLPTPRCRGSPVPPMLLIPPAPREESQQRRRRPEPPPLPLWQQRPPRPRGPPALASTPPAAQLSSAAARPHPQEPSQREGRPVQGVDPVDRRGQKLRQP